VIGGWADKHCSGQSSWAGGGPWRLERILTRKAECIEICDRLINLTDRPIGIRLGHEIVIRQAELRKVYLNGRRGGDHQTRAVVIHGRG